jgi:hypothetical protein
LCSTTQRSSWLSPAGAADAADASAAAAAPRFAAFFASCSGARYANVKRSFHAGRLRFACTTDVDWLAPA